MKYAEDKAMNKAIKKLEAKLQKQGKTGAEIYVALKTNFPSYIK
jgi:hypothetical protein